MDTALPQLAAALVLLGRIIRFRGRTAQVNRSEFTVND